LGGDWQSSQAALYFK